MPSKTRQEDEMIQQIRTNLSNTLNTFGAESRQYQYVLEMLKEYIEKLEEKGERFSFSKTENDTSDLLAKALAALRLER